MNALAPIGRVMFALIFIVAAPGHFKQDMIAHAAQAGVPLANIAVPASGILSLVGALMIALGFHARLGGLALLLFLIPVTLFMHKFWGLPDPQQTMMQQVNFMKNVGLMGGCLFFMYAGAGAYSLDARRAPVLTAPTAW